MALVLTLGAGVWTTIADPWSEPLVARAFAELVLLGVVGGMLGCWIVLYGLSYNTESFAHAMFPGLVVAALAGFPVVLGGALGLALAVPAIALAGRTPEVGSDSAVAVVVSGLVGLGALLALAADSPPRLDGLLFGDILGVSNLDLALAAGLAAVTMAGVVLLHRQLLLVGFDRSSAAAMGGRPLLVDVCLLGLVALAVLVGVQGLGTLLVVTVLIAPAAAAQLAAPRVVPMMAIAVLFAAVSGAGGLYLSYYADTAGGASIAATAVGLYVAVRLLSSATRTASPARAI